jgi:two-component system response regulator LytT
MRVFLVDDEAPARSELRYLLSAHDDVRVVGEAASAAEALAFEDDLDAIFLDVEMPGASGLELARLTAARARPPAVIFVTAHTGYAAEAFAVEAFDYLLKPVDSERLARVLERLRERAQPPAAPVEKIPVVAGGRTELVDFDQIHYIRADGDYSRVHTFDRAYLCTATLGALEETLPADRFLRIHRSHLVNLAKVAAVERAGTDRLRLVLADADRTELEVARRQAPRLRERLKLR